MILLDENFKEIKSFLAGRFRCSALNYKSVIYVSINEKNCVISLDLNLNQLKTIWLKWYGK